MSEALSLQVRALMEQVRLAQAELERHAHILYLPNGKEPLTQKVPLLAQRLAALAESMTTFEREFVTTIAELESGLRTTAATFDTKIDALDATMTAQHTALSAQVTAQQIALTAQVTALRLTITRYVSIIVGVALTFQVVIWPLLSKWGEKLLK